MSSSSMAGARPARIIAALAMVWALYALVASAQMAFCFEEIEALKLAATAKSWGGALTALHSDGYHSLTTLWMRLLRMRSAWIFYRLPSLFAGVVSVLLLARIAFRRGNLVGVVASVLGATCSLFLLYGGDARGFSLALCFFLACVDRLEHVIQRPRVREFVLFNVVALLGVLSHPSFAWAYAGLVAYGAWETWRKHESAVAVLSQLLALHTLPAAAFVALGVASRSHTASSAGPQAGAGTAAAEAITTALGANASVELPLLLVIAGVGLFTCWRLARRGERRWLLYLFGLVGGPLAFVLAGRSTQITSGAFVPAIGLGVLMLADFLGEVGRSRAGFGVAMAIVVAIAGMNVMQSVTAARYGRGHYDEAIRAITDASADGPMTLSSDNENHTLAMLWFYSPMIDLAGSIRYIPPKGLSNVSPEWLLLESRDPVLHPQKTVQIARGTSYKFVEAYPFSTRLTGFGWMLYRQDRGEGSTPTAFTQ